MYRDSILSLPLQFAYSPDVRNGEKFMRASKFAIAGMGGSHLAADIITAINPALDVVVHNDYGLPPVSDVRERLLVLSSHSGNTEEVLDTLKTALEAKIIPAAIASGGELLNRAKSLSLPYVELPSVSLQPRAAVGYALRALLALMKQDNLLRETESLKNVLRPAQYEERGKLLAGDLQGATPVVLSSARNRAIGYYWKITLNETGKSPAFSNVLPEFNHNEMMGADSRIAAVFLRDLEDDPRIKRRMDISSDMLAKKGARVHQIVLDGESRLEKIFNSLIFAQWTAYYIAQSAGEDPEAVPMVEEFKEAMKK